MSSSTAEAQALALFRAGRLEEAHAAWSAILARNPDDPQALHMAGYILTRLGRRDEGLALIDRSIERAPRVGAFLNNRAQVLSEAGRMDEAIRDLRRAVHLEPRFLEAYCHLGILLQRAGRAEEALAAFRRALAIDPGHPLALYNLGVLRLVARDLAAAEDAFRRVVEREPRNAMAANNLGVVARDTGRPDEALAWFGRACECDARNVEALNNLGLALQRAGRIDEAIARYESAARLRPTFVAALVNWGNALKDRGDLDAAAEAYARALAADAASPAALMNAASVALDRGGLDEAQNLYRRALEVRPGWADAEYGLAQVALRRLDLRNGWRGYERRFETDPPQAVRRSFAIPRLNPDELHEGMRVAVWREQGVGDQILFSTLLPELAQRGLQVVAEVDERLLAMYRRSVPAVDFVAPEESARAFAACDRELPIGSLPSLLRPDAASFSRQPAALLEPDAPRVEAMRTRLGAGRWIAISWKSLQGGERRALAARKSIPLEAFAAFAEAAGARLLDVQYGDVREERTAFQRAHPGVLTHLEDLDTYADLEGVAAALAACEDVVTASNVTAHLAGIIGRPTRVLHLGEQPPFAYWASAGDGRCLWYPSVTVIGGARLHSWEEALAAAAA